MDATKPTLDELRRKRKSVAVAWLLSIPGGAIVAAIAHSLVPTAYVEIGVRAALALTTFTLLCLTIHYSVQIVQARGEMENEL